MNVRVIYIPRKSFLVYDTGWRKVDLFQQIGGKFKTIMKPGQIIFIIILIFGLSLYGCAFVDVKTPYDSDLDRTELGSKTGTSEAYSVLWLFAWGDASYAKAAENGDITILRSADQEIFQVLFGLYTRWRIVVYGD